MPRYLVVLCLLAAASSAAEIDELIGFFRQGNAWSLEQLRARFESGPVDWPALQPPTGETHQEGKP